MKTDSQDYSLFLRFIETYSPVGFNSIDPKDPLLLELEQMMEQNDQFFYIADIIQIKVLYTSDRSRQMIGIEPADVSPYFFMEATHPDDVQRLNLGRAKVIKMAQDLFIEGKGYALLSTDYKIRNAAGEYSSFLIQTYMYYTSVPYKTVFFLKVHTNINWCKKLRHGYHYYVGNDMAFFRYPDEDLLNTGNVLTDREFEIVRLIGSGFSTEGIAEKLYLSPLTINSHRRNILKKCGKAHIPDLIYDLRERGLL
jgi:hypothetical protein